MDDVIAHQQVSIADYYNSQGLFGRLGGHFSGCQKPELDLMNKRKAYPQQVYEGMKAVTEEDTSHHILNLIKAIKGYDTLWEGLKAGFADGIGSRIDLEKNDRTLVHLALGLRAYPEIETAFKEKLSDKKLILDIKTLEIGWGEQCSVVNFKRADQEPQVFVLARGHLANIQDLSRQEDYLRRVAERAFPQHAPA